MSNLVSRFIFLSLLISLVACNSRQGNENTSVLIKTTLGDIRVQLYDSTPIHRDNFIRLIKAGVYDGVTFHRVIQDFMIQSGDPNTRQGHDKNKKLSDTLSTYTIPAEIKPEYFHKKGALAAAREGNEVNPEMRSSGTQFYLVQGTRLTDDELDGFERSINNNIKQAVFSKYVRSISDSAKLNSITMSNGELQEKASIRMFDYLTSHPDFKIPSDQRQVYKSIGGVPRLDGSYTVFGEVTEGLDVIDRIAAAKTDETDKPVSDIKILKMKIVK